MGVFTRIQNSEYRGRVAKGQRFKGGRARTISGLKGRIIPARGVSPGYGSVHQHDPFSDPKPEEMA